MWRHGVLFGLLCGLGLPLSAAPLVMVVDTSAVMPEARVSGERVLAGLHVDLAAALSRRLAREIQVRAVPRRRIAQVLEGGEADLVCDYQRNWLPGPFEWSRGFIPDQTLLISAASAPAPGRVGALAGVPVGTVLGYAYPEVSEALGAAFVRDDAPDAETNLRKLELGRVTHALTGRRQLDYQLRIGALRLELHPPLVVAEVKGQCGLSRRSEITLGALNLAIQGLVGDGELARLLAAYR